MEYNYDREELSIHYGPGWPELPTAIVIHSTRSGVSGRASIPGHDLEARSTYNWFKSPASRASSNAIVSVRETILSVPDDRYAWHAKEHSFSSLSIEVTQALSEYRYWDEQYEQVADLCRYWCIKFDIPMVYRPAWVDGMRGLTGHEDSPQGLRDGKSDPGLSWNWEKFMKILRRDTMPTDKQIISASKIFNRAQLSILRGNEPTPADQAALTWLLQSWRNN